MRCRPGTLDRFLDDTGGNLIQDHEALLRQLDHTKPQEVEQQVRVPLSGKAGNGWGFKNERVKWELPFIYAPGSRGLVPFNTPHFSVGIELGTGTSDLIVIHAQVVEWTITPYSTVTGATVRFASQAPMLQEEEFVNYSAIAHLTFQGWACEEETGEEE